MFCNKCGAMLEEDAQYCSMCGNKMEYTPQIRSDKEKENNKFSAIRGYKFAVAVLSVLLILAVAAIVFYFVKTDNRVDGETNVNSTTTDEGSKDERILSAITALTQKWTEIYAENGTANGYLEIYNTRLIDISPDANDYFFEELERGMEIDYVVEFSIYSDYFSTAPYYHNAEIYDTVVVYNDGTSNVASNLLQLYSSLTYSYDYSGFLEGVSDYGTDYNDKFMLN